MKLTDEQIEGAATRRTMVVHIGYDDWAMSQEDAMAILAIFTRAVKVEHIHSSNYRHDVWIPTDDQTPPVESATIAKVRVPETIGQDQFSAATRAVS